tara:strand:- start:2415 stop:3224 length:810 start_codon:yes stop_codon:yes gene_type:complete
MLMISTNNGGLSNRLKSYVSALRLDPHSKIFWPILNSYRIHNHILNCSFSKLFKNDIEVDTYTQSNIYNSHCLAIKESDDLPKNFNTFTSKCSVKFSKSDSLQRNIDFMYHKIPNHIKNEYIQLFKIFIPIDELQNKINRFSQQFNEKTISVHIRSWNRNKEMGRRSYLFNIQKYEKQMDTYDNTYTFYISTDSQQVKDYFQNQNKYNVLFYPRSSDLNTSRDFELGIQEDLIELYLLSKNSIFIGSHFSTFSEVAWYLGGCTKNITIV